MNKIIKFGEDIQGFEIPVLNEREIRAAAGLLFVLMIISILLAILKGDFLLLKYAITIFLTDISIRVFINPKYSPFLIAGRLIVSNQTPEYVGAPQKKFAWAIGFILAATMFILLPVLNTRSPITGIICLICLVFLFFETSFGICLGCKFYPLLHPEKAQYCPGDICEIKIKQDIQKTSGAQICIVFGFIVYIFLLAVVLNNSFSKKPDLLFSKKNHTLTE